MFVFFCSFLGLDDGDDTGLVRIRVSTAYVKLKISYSMLGVFGDVIIIILFVGFSLG